MEIEMFFAKYDVDGDGEFSYEEGQQLVEDLENDRIDQVWSFKETSSSGGF